MEPLLTRHEVANKLGISLSTLSNNMTLGKIPRPDFVLSRKLARWRESTIRDFIASGGRVAVMVAPSARTGKAP